MTRFTIQRSEMKKRGLRKDSRDKEFITKEV